LLQYGDQTVETHPVQNCAGPGSPDRQPADRAVEIDVRDLPEADLSRLYSEVDGS
jgi:hypothetical protein